MKVFCALCALCVLAFPAFSLDREAFTFAKYDLNVRIEPEQQRLAVRGKITLRNDSGVPQKDLSLQISSTLDWRSIRFDGKPVQFETHQYTSDIDHTGALSEAIVTLSQNVPPKATIELEIGYEGVVLLDATRLTRIGVPEDKAKYIDWDQITHTFTAVRGIGYVAWYPIATQAASLSEGDSVSQAVGRWIVRHADSDFSVHFQSTSEAEIFFSGIPASTPAHADASLQKASSFDLHQPGVNVPTFVIADYHWLPSKDSFKVGFLSGQQEAAEAYAEIASQTNPPVGRGPRNLQILGLPDDDDVPFVTAGMLLTPLKSPMTNQTELDIVYALARQIAPSHRAWIEEGLSHYAQASFIEAQKGRQAATGYLDTHRSILLQPEKFDGAKLTPKDLSLIDAPDDLYLQTKAMYVWWMLKDMLGSGLTEALDNYDPSDDRDPVYLQKLLEKQCHCDLEWFFDDWVYHDRGLPDFRVASVFSTPIAAGGYLVTIEIENQGSAGAEVPITLQTGTEEIRRRLIVHAKSKASLRIETQSAAKEVTVNDGSVPESDISNNTYKIETPTK
jgi:hypothetical protein